MYITLEHRNDRILIEISQEIRELYKYYKTDKLQFMLMAPRGFDIRFEEKVWYYFGGSGWFFTWLEVLTKIQAENVISKREYKAIQNFIGSRENPPLGVQMLTWTRTEIVHYHLNPDILLTYKEV